MSDLFRTFDEDRRAILRAASAMLSSVPSQELHRQVIAEKAGVSAVTVSRAFRTRADLLDALMDSGLMTAARVSDTDG